jgi:predicted nucleotide-binding protein (sugar kinase/HSP70/actin superfamily)
MVRRTRVIKWTEKAVLTRKSILKYWNNRNKSKVYSTKLNHLFKEGLKIVADFSESAQESSKKDVRLKLVRDYYLVYQITIDSIIVLDVWDTRQNPINHPLK